LGKLRPNRGVPVLRNSLERVKMTDLLMLVMGLGFFAIALAYVTACSNM
jgi:hypothetical protein